MWMLLTDASFMNNGISKMARRYVCVRNVASAFFCKLRKHETTLSHCFIQLLFQQLRS